MDRRLIRATAVAFVVAILASEVLKGNSPSPTGSAQEIERFFRDHRSSILVSGYLQMLALVLFAVVFASLSRLTPREVLSGRLAWLGLVLVLVAYTTYVFLTSALAFGAAHDAGPAVGKSLWEIRFVAETFVNFPVALVIGAVAFASRAVVNGSWYRWTSLAIAGAFLVGGGAVARNGFFAPDGGYGFILFWLLPLWVLLTAFLGSRTFAPSVRPRGGSALRAERAEA